MTKEQREDDIKDYIAYLNRLWESLSNKYTFKNKVLLGCSQGGATASRWHCLGNYNAKQFLLWSAVFPPDMSKDYCDKFKQSKNYFVFGNKDEYYDNHSIETHFKQLNQLNFNFEFIKFEGNHNIDSKLLVNLIA